MSWGGDGWGEGLEGMWLVWLVVAEPPARSDGLGSPS